MHDALIGELTRLIATTCDAEQVLADHRCVHGDRCSCSTPNVSRPWPCTTRQGALRAHELVLASKPRMVRAR